MRLGLVFVVLTTTGLSGCGTTANLCCLTQEQGGRQPYGGVQVDLSVVQWVADDTATVRERFRNSVAAAVCVADLPL
jgi:uncharacterized protein YceK